MNTPVNFEVAKLLKLKKFNLKCQRYYRAEGSALFNDEFIEQDSKDWNSSFYPDDVTSAPTITEVVMWLYEKHEIWIVSLPELNNGTDITYYPCVYEQGVGEDLECCFNLPTEAYEAGINYCLTNLI